MNWLQFHSQGYYRMEAANGCNICDQSQPLIANCSGVTVLNAAFSSSIPSFRRDHYLMFLLHGKLEVRVDGLHHDLLPGQMIIYPPNRPYSYRMPSDDKLVYLWIHFTGSQAQSILDSRGLKHAQIYQISDSETLENDFEIIHRLFITRPLFFMDEITAQLYQLLTHAGRDAASVEEARPVRRLQASLNHLNRHYAEPLRLDELAGMEYLSVSWYCTLFRQVTGLSPQRYLIDLRLRNARSLLTNTDLSIAEVARSVGYDDPLYFSRLFRRHYGIPPSVLRSASSEQPQP